MKKDIEEGLHRLMELNQAVQLYNRIPHAHEWQLIRAEIEEINGLLMKLRYE